MAKKKQQRVAIRNEEFRIKEVAPGEEPTPNKLITTKREGGIQRQEPLSETHGMTTEADRFRES